VKIKKICTQCGKKFEVYPYRKNIAKYCSWKCSQLSSRKRIIKICPICNRSFEIQVSKKNQRCCSQECMGLYKTKRIKKYCIVCKKEYLPQFSRRFQSKYCSKKCVAKVNEILKKTGTYGRCLICNKKMYIRKGLENKKKYCSEKCQRIAEKKLNYRKKAKYRANQSWNNVDFIYRYFKGKSLGSNFPDSQLTDLDKKIIEGKILIHKIRRSLNEQNR